MLIKRTFLLWPQLPSKPESRSTIEDPEEGDRNLFFLLSSELELLVFSSVMMKIRFSYIQPVYTQLKKSASKLESLTVAFNRTAV